MLTKNYKTIHWGRAEIWGERVNTVKGVKYCCVVPSPPLFFFLCVCGDECLNMMLWLKASLLIMQHMASWGDSSWFGNWIWCTLNSPPRGRLSKSHELAWRLNLSNQLAGKAPCGIFSSLRELMWADTCDIRQCSRPGMKEKFTIYRQGGL